jgi:hypothetical protein
MNSYSLFLQTLTPEQTRLVVGVGAVVSYVVPLSHTASLAHTLSLVAVLETSSYSVGHFLVPYATPLENKDMHLAAFVAQSPSPFEFFFEHTTLPAQRDVGLHGNLLSVEPNALQAGVL